jgi:hypothetical protein
MRRTVFQALTTPRQSRRRAVLSFLAPTLALPLAVACGPSMGPQTPTRPPLATQWLDRAKASYKAGDFDDARDAAQRALGAAPSDPEIRELAARIALVRLEFTEALKLSEGVETSEAHSTRGRAYWFSGDLEHAADELEAWLSDPKVKDEWAREVASLARRGTGRHPFELEGGIVSEVDMPRAIDRVPIGAWNVVPCEMDGERILALIATGTSEVLVDSSARHDPSWVDFRFDRVEVKDVPALVQDLSPITRQLGVPIKALLGAQLLRHAHVTFDRHGDQFVVRRQDPSPPPDASRVPLFYVRGGGMLLRATVTRDDHAWLPLLVDSSRGFHLLLQDSAWKMAGVDLLALETMPEAPNTKKGTLPTFHMGGYDLAKLPAYAGAGVSELTNGIDIDLAGVVGVDTLAYFRVTFADEGRSIWIEGDPTLFGPTQHTSAAMSSPPPPAPAGGAAPAPPAASAIPFSGPRPEAPANALPSAAPSSRSRPGSGEAGDLPSRSRPGSGEAGDLPSAAPPPRRR